MWPSLRYHLTSNWSRIQPSPTLFVCQIKMHEKKIQQQQQSKTNLNLIKLSDRFGWTCKHLAKQKEHILLQLTFNIAEIASKMVRADGCRMRLQRSQVGPKNVKLEIKAKQNSRPRTNTQSYQIEQKKPKRRCWTTAKHRPEQQKHDKNAFWCFLPESVASCPTRLRFLIRIWALPSGCNLSRVGGDFEDTGWSEYTAKRRNRYRIGLRLRECFLVERGGFKAKTTALWAD